MRYHRSRFLSGLFVLSALLFIGTTVRLWAHAFPDHSEPRVGSSVETPPATVRIWFDSGLEAAFSSLRVVNSDDKQVDKGDGHVDDKDNTIMEVSLPPLPPGKYHVYWVAISVDTHRTEGDYSFWIEAPK
jgi:methionine-rich copper-binding protein CopC